MSILSDHEIKAEIHSGSLDIHPMNNDDIKSASVDLHLSDQFLISKPHQQIVIDPKEDQTPHTSLIQVDPCEAFVLHPGQFVIASTTESFKLPDYLVGRLEGKSSVARLGLIIHTAGFVDPGFEGDLTLEIANLNSLPSKLYPGMPIAQIAFLRMETRATHPYSRDHGSHYQGQRGPTPSRLWEWFLKS